MSSSKRVFLIAAGLSVMLAAAAEAYAQHKLPKLSDQEIQRIKDVLPESATARPAKPRKVLIFWLCEGFFHGDGIAAGNKAFELMGEKTGAYTTVASDDMSMFDADNLKQFDAVIFNNTTALSFKNPAHRKALLDFVNGGKGVVGTHSSVDNFYKWPEGAAMMGALFAGHPWGEAPVKLDDPSHPLVKAFGGKGFWFRDEIYKMRDPYSREKLRVLLSFDMSKMKPGAPTREDKDNPIAWIHQVGKGRVFYCSLGHSKHVFWDPTLLKFYLAGVQYALGDLTADATPSAKLSPQPKPALAPEK